ncbi:SIS domain-containing protein [Endozoicomonas elysicola]|uniref:Sugar isomerase n=1 Tax=Endozoicomonas elysicola TaxID=305900 RepID=A0A081KGS6_9GAMM|nr:SIS domain-containing protein [Endozoicomonas elysicola]KEI73352.1 sugar isomerase [Endozoicomonas elysicola]
MSTYLGMDESFLRDIGGEQTAVEISQQPRVWREALANIEACRAELDAFLAPLLAKENLRVVLSGAGTSAFAGQVVAPHLARVTGRRFEAVSTTDVVASPAECFAEQVPTLVISIARSGRSPESVATVELADQLVDECYHLLLTCNPEGDLALASQSRSNMFCLLMPEGTNDRGFAMTSSYTSMMLSALCIFDREQGTAELVEKLSQVTEQLLEDKIGELKALAEQDFERLVFLGSASLKGLAQEASLKFLELTAGKVVSVFDSPLGFRHGPKSIVNDKTVIIEFMTNDSYTRQYDLDLLAELRRDDKAAHILAISDECDDDVRKGNAMTLGQTLETENVWLSFPFIALAQVFAFFKSVQLQITPDNPCPTGEVNRVVQGVIIHPYNKQ